jgi:hypothetical protein
MDAAFSLQQENEAWDSSGTETKLIARRWKPLPSNG